VSYRLPICRANAPLFVAALSPPQLLSGLGPTPPPLASDRSSARSTPPRSSDTREDRPGSLRHLDFDLEVLPQPVRAARRGGLTLIGGVTHQRVLECS
jgi:hypothetical protein